MRYFILISFLFLASCATPQTEPQSFYGQIYAPGNVTIDGSGVFNSTAKVKSVEFIREARLAAYLRLMENAIISGYRSVRIDREEVTDFIGYKVTIHGRLYLSDQLGEGIYPISSISRILRGLPIRELNPVAIVAAPLEKKYKAKPKAKRKVKKIKVKTIKKPITKVKSKPVIKTKKKKVVTPEPEPIALPEPSTVPDEVDEDIGVPTIIMAPEDITGSVLKAANDNGDIKIKSTAVFSPSAIAPNAIAIPKALSGTPLGVVIRNK